MNLKVKIRPLEFKVNDYITLKLEDKETIIYVNGKRFDQCRFLLIDIPIDEIKSLDEIESIDEAEEKLEKLDSGLEPIYYSHPINRIPPETEFWGNCSILQAWCENNYNTRLLHRYLAFPLLRRLSNLGDPVAKNVFKEEITKRFSSGHLSVVKLLLEEGYLDYLEAPERQSLLSNCEEILKENLLIYLKEWYFSESLALSILINLAHLKQDWAKNLLKKPLVERAFEGEITKGFEGINPTLILYLMDEGYDEYLNKIKIIPSSLFKKTRFFQIEFMLGKVIYDDPSASQILAFALNLIGNEEFIFFLDSTKYSLDSIFYTTKHGEPMDIVIEAILEGLVSNNKKYYDATISVINKIGTDSISYILGAIESDPFLDYNGLIKVISILLGVSDYFIKNVVLEIIENVRDLPEIFFKGDRDMSLYNLKYENLDVVFEKLLSRITKKIEKTPTIKNLEILKRLIQHITEYLGDESPSYYIKKTLTSLSNNVIKKFKNYLNMKQKKCKTAEEHSFIEIMLKNINKYLKEYS